MNFSPISISIYYFFYFVPTKQKLVSNWGKKNIFRLSRENFGSNKFIMADGHILQIHQKRWIWKAAYGIDNTLKKNYGDKKLWSNFSQICLNIKKLRKWHMMVAGLVAFKLPHPHPPGLIPL